MSVFVSAIKMNASARAMLWKLFVHKQSSFMGNILLLRIECVDRIVTVTAKKKTLNNICQQQHGQHFFVTRIDESTELIIIIYLQIDQL